MANTAIYSVPEKIPKIEGAIFLINNSPKTIKTNQKETLNKPPNNFLS